MADTIFKKVEYQLINLVDDIERGRIGLPEIQRGYVWDSKRVRDLFDSLYKGYPVGYLMLWENGADEGSRNIGTDTKQEVPSRMVVDGQQRMTSLYSVMKGREITHSDKTVSRIQIAFNPLEEQFYVPDAATQQDSRFVSDISKVWDSSVGLIRLSNDYLKELRASGHSVSDEEVSRIENAFTKLSQISSYPFSALELNAEITDEAVHEVFVRINSAGVDLSQSDFVLTRISVFWNDGRTELEQFCDAARTPTRGITTPYNQFIEPEPDQLLRVSVGLAFRRARLSAVYAILSGRSLATGQYSKTDRELQFQKLRESQKRVLDVNNWHEFMRCLRYAGFRSRRMISSNYNLLFSYIIFLFGKTEYEVDELVLRRIIGQWFFMASLTGRYTSSSESTLESDLRSLRSVNSAEEFVRHLQNVCDRMLAADFWDLTLPNNLTTISSNSPARFAYEASLVILNAPSLFSGARVADLLDPELQSNDTREFRHQLFTREYLESVGVKGNQIYNQIANFAYGEWAENVRSSMDSPATCLAKLKQGFSESDITTMSSYHALFDGWEESEYLDFLENRRRLMAHIVKEGYLKLSGMTVPETVSVELDVENLVEHGESDLLEFKSTLRTNLHTNKKDSNMEHAVLKTLAAFLNADGGTLIIGVADDGTPVGIEADGFQNEDHMSRHLINLINDKMDPNTARCVHLNFDDFENTRVLVVKCERSPREVYLKEGNKEAFFVRTGPASTELTTRQAHDYIRSWFGR